MKRRNNTRGMAVTEYAFLITVVMLAGAVMYKYVYRGIAGRWKEAGDAMGFGRIYDPKQTTECAFSPIQDVWYEVDCYEACATAHPDMTTLQQLDPVCVPGCEQAICQDN